MELKLERVTKRYGKLEALSDFSITFETGIYGILGANGAGKSTMMNLITDNIRRDEDGFCWMIRRFYRWETASVISGIYAAAAGNVRTYDGGELPDVHRQAEGDQGQGCARAGAACAGACESSGCAA